jgi:hypothetical protein
MAIIVPLRGIEAPSDENEDLVLGMPVGLARSRIVQDYCCRRDTVIVPFWIVH